MSHPFERRTSLEGLLHDIYDDWHPGHCSLDTESWTDTSISNFSDYLSPTVQRRRSSLSTRKNVFSRRSTVATGAGWFLHNESVDEDERNGRRYDKQNLMIMDTFQLSQLITRLRAEVASTSLLLIKHLKRREHQMSRMRARCNVMTAILQAMSPKRSVDAKLQFTLEPPVGENGYDQWLNAMRSVARLPDGMPPHFRKRLWLTLADHYVKMEGIDWEATSKRAFNDRMNDDDDELSLQIVKDLHRTGWSGLNGDVERILLKRVLLAYARYNKTIGYCQGFNVIAALILEIMEYNEEPALKVMIMLIEKVLPSGYFDQTLRALSVDMAVLRDLIHQRLPRLSAHLDHLMMSSESEFEPPLTNVFSMQWFLTLFATCLPKQAVFRIWDSLMLEGSEILLRAALAIWAKIGRRIYKAKSADSYYTIMGVICQELLHMNNDQCNDLMQVIYTMADFPYPGLSELRDKYTWNIQPFSSAFRLLRQQVVSILKSDDEGGSDLVSGSPKHASGSKGFLTPPAQGSSKVPSHSAPCGSASDLSKLEKQYKLIRQRQKQAAIILQNALASSNGGRQSTNSRPIIPTSRNTPTPSQNRESGGDSDIFNHLYLSRSSQQAIATSTLNGTVSIAPRVVQPTGQTKSIQSKSTASKNHDSGNKSSRPNMVRRLRSDDSVASSDASTVVPPTTLASPPSSPASIGTVSYSSTPTSSGGGSTPGLWTPAHSPKSSFVWNQEKKQRRYSLGDIGNVRSQRQPMLRRWHTDSELSIFAPNSAPASNGISKKKPMNGMASKESMHSPILHRPTPPPIPPRPFGERTKQYTRPPPLDLRKLSNGNAPRTSSSASSVSGRIRTSSNTSPTFSMTNGTTSTSAMNHASMLKKSKAILASISSNEDDEHGDSRRSSATIRNPFPVKRQTALIERGKRLGLYS